MVKTGAKKSTKVEKKPSKKINSSTKVEDSMIDESLELLKSLNEKVLLAHKAKEKLEKDVETLKKKVTSHVAPSVSKELTLLKKELLDDFAPLFKKLHVPSLKKTILADFTKVIDKELQKIRVEVESHLTKSDKDTRKLFSTLEVKLLDSLKEHALLKKELSQFDGKQLTILLSNLEKKLQQSLVKSEKKLKQDLVSTLERVKLLEKELKKYTSEIKTTSKQLKSEKTKLKKSLQEEGIDFSSLESKILKLTKDFSSLQSLVSRFENDLYEKKRRQKSQLEKEYEKGVKKLQTLLENFDKEKEAQQEFITTKINELVEEVETFETKLSSLEKNSISNIKKHVDTKVLNTLVKDLEDYKKKLDHEFSQIKVEINDFLAESHSSNALEIKNFEKEMLSKQNLFESTVNNLSDKIVLFEKKIRESEDLIQKKSDQIKHFSKDLQDQIIARVKEFESHLKKENEDVFQTFVEESKEYLDQKLALFKKELSSFTKSITNYKKSMSKTQEILEKKIHQLDEFTQREITLLIQQFEGIDSVSSSLNESLQDQSKKVLSLEEALSQFSSKISKLEEEFSQLPSQDKKKLKEISENILGEISETFSKKFSQLKDAYDLFFTEKINSFVSELEGFEKRLEKLEMKNVKELKKVVSEELEESLKTLEHSVSEKTSKEYFKLKEFSEKEFESIKEKADFVFSNLKSFKEETQKLLKDYISELDNEVISLKKEVEQQSKIDGDKIHNVLEKLSVFEKTYKGIENYIAQRYNELVSHFEELSKTNALDFERYKKELELHNSNLLSNEIQVLREKIAEEIASYQEHVTRTSLELKEEQRSIRERLEDSFSHLKTEFDELFKKQLYSYEQDLQQRESEFISKLTAIEHEKETVVNDLKQLHIDIQKQSQKFDEKLEKDLLRIEEKEVNIEEKKREFLEHIDSIIHTKRVQFEEDFKEAEFQIKNLVSQIKQDQLEEEDSFRNTFTEKIRELKQLYQEKLASIEKKFVEKNLSKVQKEIDSSFERFKLVEETLHSKQEELGLKIEQFEQKELDFFENLHAEQESLKEKIETRLMQLEKQFNKRFLDFDVQFGDFKAIVIEEVEDLMKEVNQLVTSKFESMKNQESKLKFIVSEGEKRIAEFGNVRSIVEEELRDIRDDLQSVKIQQDLQQTQNQTQSLQTMVSTLSDYETHLLDLIDTLREKGISNDHILQVLVSKGHPRVYTSMLLQHSKKSVKQ
jgi:DNA repair exonuclease SbcCD ATPase subunit